jgi:hypothetical protein
VPRARIPCGRPDDSTSIPLPAERRRIVTALAAVHLNPRGPECAHRHPRPALGFVETIKADLGWTEADSDEHTVDRSAIEMRDGEKLYLIDTL